MIVLVATISFTVVLVFPAMLTAVVVRRGLGLGGKLRKTTAAVFCVLALLAGGAAFVASVFWDTFLEVNRNIDLCWDTSHPDYIQDPKLREETCKKTDQ